MTILEARALEFGYENQEALIDEWSASFCSGETVAITGPSGSGKSTLLYLLGLMLRPRAGEILLDGQVVSGLIDSRKAWIRAHEFGFVFQDAALDPTRTVLDNVLEGALYRDVAREGERNRAALLLEKFGVVLRAESRPGEVSGGQAQRVALCRALLSDPKVILADEPTGNLDAASAEIVIGALKESASEGSIVVIVTHDESLVARCDRRMDL